MVMTDDVKIKRDVSDFMKAAERRRTNIKDIRFMEFLRKKLISECGPDDKKVCPHSITVTVKDVVRINNHMTSKIIEEIYSCILITQENLDKVLEIIREDSEAQESIRKALQTADRKKLRDMVERYLFNKPEQTKKPAED